MGYPGSACPRTWRQRALNCGVLFGLIIMLSLPALSQQQQTVKRTVPSGDVAPAPIDSTTAASSGARLNSPTGNTAITPTADAATGNGIDFHGGPLMLATHNVYFVWYGNWNGNSATSLLPQFMQNLSNSPYFSINTTYEDASNPVHNIGSSVGMSTQTFDVYSHGSALTESAIQAVISGAISRSALPVDANGIYFVLGSPDVTATKADGKRFCHEVCGWHNHTGIAGADIKYAFVGDAATQCINNPSNPVTCAANSNQTASPNGNVGADAMISVMAHELDETVTDPDLNAWYQTSSGNENADLCAWKFAPTFTAPNGAQANLTLAGVNYLVQKNWLNDTDWQNPPDPTDPAGTHTNCTLASTGNTFLYASAHDQYYACHGMASASTADCSNITDANDRLFCQAVAQHSQTPCSTPITDRNLQLSCFGIAFAPNFPSNCRDITNPQMQSFCYGISSGGSPVTPNCSTVADPDTRALCNGMATHDPTQCSSISNVNDRQFCLGVAGNNPAQCSTISSCPDPNAQASCLNSGGTWDWNACSCTAACDPAQQQACIAGGGIWNSTDCTCFNSGCGTQLICSQTLGTTSAPLANSAPLVNLNSRAITRSLLPGSPAGRPVR